MRKQPDIFKKKFYFIDENNCWIWTGQKWSSGYGYTRAYSPHFRDVKCKPAHRYMYALYKGNFDHSLDVLHKCDNPTCVNPDHLFLGTHSDNMKDMYNKNRRSQRGAYNGNYRHGKYAKDM